MMRRRGFVRLIALFLVLCLCGCNSILTQDNKQYSDMGSDSFITYDEEKGEYVQAETYDITKMTGKDAKVTIDEEYAKELPKDVQGTMEKKQVEDHEALWKADGVAAFFIPNYHSTKAEDLKDFSIIDLTNNMSTVIYGYETVFYGKNPEQPLCGLSERGTAPTEHVNWDIPENKKDDSSYKPDSKYEVYCLMEYTPETRKYRVLGAKVGLIQENNSGTTNTSSTSGTEQLYENYMPSTKRLFCGKVTDLEARYGSVNLYYSMYDTYFTLFNGKGEIIKQLEASSLFMTSIQNYLIDKKINEITKGIPWLKLQALQIMQMPEFQDWLKKQKITYSIANVLMNGNARLMVELNVTVTEQTKTESKEKKEEGTPYSLVCTYTMLATDKNGSGTEFRSDNAALSGQIQMWQSNPGISYEDVIKQLPDTYSWFGLYDSSKGTTSDRYRLCAVKVNDDQFLEDDINLGYFNRMFEQYFDSYRSTKDSQKKETTEQQDDALWKQAYQYLCGATWSEPVERTVPAGKNPSKEEGLKVADPEQGSASNTKDEIDHYKSIMQHVARPATVTGNNYQYILDENDANANMRFGIYDEEKTDSSMGSSIYRTSAAKVGNWDVVKELATREYTDEDGNTVTETANFVAYATIKLIDNNVSAERFDTVEIEDGKNLLQTPSGDVAYYQSSSGEKDSELTTIWMPYYKGIIGRIQENDICSSVKILSETTEYDTKAVNLIVAALGDQKIWIYYCRRPGSTSDPKYEIPKKLQIPYTMAITPVAEIGTVTTVEYKDDNGNTVTTEAGQKAVLSGNNAIDYEPDTGDYRFTTLQSGIVVYDSDKKRSIVIDNNQYYASWKHVSGSYTAIGFNTRTQDAGFEDIMKAKFYKGLDISEEDRLLLTFKDRLKIDTEMQKRFLTRPDGWKAVCKEYQIDPDKTSASKIEEYAKKIYGIYDAYDKALQDFWKMVKFQPTAEQREKIEAEFLQCSETVSMDRLIQETLIEYIKSQESTVETTEAQIAENEVDDGWIKKIKKSQDEALDKQRREKYARELVDNSAEINYQADLKRFVQAVNDKRTVWDQ